MTDEAKRFWDAASDAVDNFKVVSRTDSMIEAEAGTGSRYVVHRIPASGGAWLMVVRWPHKAMHEVGESAYLYPSYFAQCFIDPDAPLYSLNGGDVYGLLLCFRELIGVTFPDPGGVVA